MSMILNLPNHSANRRACNVFLTIMKRRLVYFSSFLRLTHYSIGVSRHQSINQQLRCVALDSCCDLNALHYTKEYHFHQSWNAPGIAIKAATFAEQLLKKIVNDFIKRLVIKTVRRKNSILANVGKHLASDLQIHKTQDVL